jgi:hypothetical protein
VANLTVTISADVLQRARLRAMQQGTSVNALIRSYLEAFADADRAGESRRALVEMSERTASGSGPNGRTWTRDELHDR